MTTHLNTLEQPKECQQRAHERDEAAARRFCSQFVLLLGALLTGITAFNLFVNPFAQYSTHFFAPIVQMSRADKLRLFADLATAPDGLVLGSSRVLKLEPKYLEQTSGQTFFNAGVNYAVPTDHLAWFRHYVSHFGLAPKTVIVGLDLSSFSPSVKTDARLISHPVLSRYVRHSMSFNDRWARWSELLAWQQTRASLRSLKHHLLRESRPEPIEAYRPDGLLIYLQREQQIADGTYDYDGPLEFNKHEYESRYRGFDRLAQPRIDEFEQLVTACQQHGTRLIAFLTPMHPQLRNHLSQIAPLESRRRELTEHLQQRSMEAIFEFHDLIDIATYGGDVAQFVDGIHQLEPNTRKLVDLFFRSGWKGADSRDAL